MPTVSGEFLRSDGTPMSGSVAFAPSVAIGDAAEVRLPAPCEVRLDAEGKIEVDLPATDDPAYTPAGWVWEVRERIAGGRDPWHFTLTADADYWDLAAALPPEDYLPWTFTATATTGAPGTDADVDVTGTPPAPVFEFVIPRGDKGTAGPTTDLSIGTVTTLPPGDPATADITGTPPTLTLDLGIPEGVKGDTGAANVLSVGTVTTGAAGSSAAATITGTTPAQVLNLTIPRGDTGEVPAARTISTTAPLTGGGDLSANRTFAISNGGITPIYLGGGYRASATAVTIGADDYLVDLTGGSVTQALPPAATAGAGRRYLIRNSGSGTVTVTGVTTIPGRGWIDVISTGSAWVVLDGKYDTESAGLAKYEWRRGASPGWRLIAYDSGVRDVSADWGTASGLTITYAQIQRLRDGCFVNVRFTATSAISDVSYALPIGFRPRVSNAGSSGFRSDLASERWVLRAVAPSVLLTATAGASVNEANLWFPAAPALPTSLPGTQITAPV